MQRPHDRRLATIAIAIAVAAANSLEGGTAEGAPRPPQEPARAAHVAPIPFAEISPQTKKVYNASGVVPLGDSRYLLCDNNTNHALIRLELTPDGRQAAPLVLLPLTGLDKEAVDDMEDLAIVREGDRWYIFATPSLSIKPSSKKKAEAARVRPSGLVRITVAGDKRYVAEAMPNFRDWFIAHVPALAATGDKEPDLGGLNVEGLAWDADRRALLFGVRTPVLDRAPIVVPVRLKDLAGKWDASNLEALEPIRLKLEPLKGGQGIRGMASTPDRKGFLIVIGNATSDDPSLFELYSWDGNEAGVVRRLPVTFERGMKPEGVTVGLVGGKPSAVFVDDAGGFRVLPLDPIPMDGAVPQNRER